MADTSYVWLYFRYEMASVPVISFLSNETDNTNFDGHQ